MSTLKDVKLELGDDIAEVRRARNWLRRQLVDLNADHAEDVVMVADELVSNSLRHGTAPREIRLVRQHASLRIEVDDGCGTPAHTRPPSVHGGRGLMLVSAVAGGWGQLTKGDGKTVWAEFAFSRNSVHRPDVASPEHIRGGGLDVAIVE
ncbi:ATP-binding protein [Lentzea sp. NPDC055074]